MSRNYQEKLSGEIISRNYDTKLSAEIRTRNYDLVYYVAQKCVNYRYTGVSKNVFLFSNVNRAINYQRKV